MNVVDSSGWLEYLADADNAGFFAAAIEAPSQLVVPTLSIYEVFKRILQQRDKDAALQAAAAMEQGTVVELSTSLALMAADLSVAHSLPMANSIILATARLHGAVLWTQDADFDGLQDVQYVRCVRKAMP
ncbi:MAG: type II toxin-antitoxin system VapC family toxin [bacterium]|nr:type II toxin-antitoxin system VapC family toxin [bacterium]